MHLNELQSQYENRGLTVIGVTSEAEDKTVPWIAEKGAKYGYAYDKGGKLANWFGVSGIPHAALVDPAGRVLWTGHPGQLPPAVLEQSLAGALTKPMWEWPAAAKGIRKDFAKQQYAKALAAAEKLAGDDGPVIAAAIKAIVTGRVAALEGLHQKGDFLGAQDLASDLQKQAAGMPEADKAGAILAAIKADKDAQTTIKVQKQLARIDADLSTLRKRGDADKLTDELNKVLEKHLEGFVGEQANALRSRLIELKAKLR